MLFSRRTSCQLYVVIYKEVESFTRFPHQQLIAPKIYEMYLFCYRAQGRIDFHHVDRLQEVVCSYVVAPYKPGHITAASPSILLYEDQSVTPRVVRWVNCGTSPPRPISGTNVTRTNHAIIWDMCCVAHGDKQLLVMTRANNGIFAYNTQRAQMGWTVKGKLTGMEIDMSIWGATADGNGHLFMCDINNSCIQMFSAGGRYMGPVLKEGDHGLAQPWLVRWCEQTSSLVVVHIKERNYQISVIRVTPEDAATDLERHSQVEVQTPAPAEVLVTQTRASAEPSVEPTISSVPEVSVALAVSDKRQQEPIQARTSAEPSTEPATSSSSVVMEEPPVSEVTEKHPANDTQVGDSEASGQLKCQGNTFICLSLNCGRGGI